MYSKVLLAFCQQKFCRIQKKRLTNPQERCMIHTYKAKALSKFRKCLFCIQAACLLLFESLMFYGMGLSFLAIKKVTGTVTFYQAHTRSFLIFSFSSSFSIPCSCKFENSVCTEPSYQNLRKSSVCCLRKLSRSIS